MGKMWCAACNAVVEAVVKTGVSKATVATATAIGALIGGASAKRKRDEGGRAIAGALVGAAVGALGDAIVRQAVPAAQKLVCGSCGCEHLSEHAS